MTAAQWKGFKALRLEFKTFCEKASALYNKDELLLECQEEVRRRFDCPEYSLENMVVYNKRLDEVGKRDDIRLILVGDNPGKNEQLSSKSRYLVGQAGKLAQGFFSTHPELGIKFNTDVLILNKSPLHTAKTAYLKKLISLYEARSNSSALKDFFLESQDFMARLLFRFQGLFGCYAFLVGYGELGKSKIFEGYYTKISQLYQNNDSLKDKLLCFQHFSMNRFTIDLKKNYDASMGLFENLTSLGTQNRNRIFAW